MNSIVETYRKLVVQIATPYSTGTGFYLREHGLIVTNEHVVRDNQQVVIHGVEIEKQLVKVLFLDQKYDLAFLKAPGNVELPDVKLNIAKPLSPGDKVLAVGHPFGKKFESGEGEVTSIEEEHNINYIHHTATLNEGNSGGPLIGDDGTIIGVNTFIIQEDQDTGFSLPVKYLDMALRGFKEGNDKVATRCFSCSKIVFENTKLTKNCNFCGASILLPSEIEPYESFGAAKTIEHLLVELNHEIELSRSGHLQWEIQQGSAKIDISYYDKTGLIIGDAYLCKIPSKNLKPLYEFLLRQNYETEGLTFSVKGQDIVLSLLINDRYLNTQTGMTLFNHLFERADYYDNVLVEKYGAAWNLEES